MNKKLVVAGTTLAIGLGTVMSAGMVHAATTSTTTNTGMSSLVKKIADKFGLKQADVQAVFDQDRIDHQAEMEANQKSRLDQAVKDGKLTQAQEDHIVQAQQEIHSLMGSAEPGQQDQTTRDKIKAKIDELRKWATDNKVDEQFVHAHGGHHGGPDGPMHQ